MLRGTLSGAEEYPLPEGYHFVFYKAGDRDSWIAIEQSAKEFDNYGEGLIEPAKLDHASLNLLSARIMLDLPNGATHYTLAAFAPNTQEAIFTVTLKSSQPSSSSGTGSGDAWYAPGGEVFQPLTTPTYPRKTP